MNTKSFECKNFDAKVMYAEIAATSILLLRRPSRKNAPSSDYSLWMCEQAPRIHRLILFNRAALFRCPDFPIIGSPDHQISR
jgi:hypothetical protein